MIAVTVALMIRFFVIEAYRIPSTAMRPTLEPGDTIFVSKSVFGLRYPWTQTKFSSGRPPRFGEVVVYAFPEDPRRDFIKRVIGLPGDTVQIKKGKVILNGSEITHATSDKAICGEEHLLSAHYAVCWEPPLLDSGVAVQVPEGQVFVAGDARTQTLDPRKSKNWELIPMSAIKGKALWVWLSIDPPLVGAHNGWFSRIRFERMFAKIQ